jgi:hypothetical protein
MSLHAPEAERAEARLNQTFQRNARKGAYISYLQRNLPDDTVLESLTNSHLLDRVASLIQQMKDLHKTGKANTAKQPRTCTPYECVMVPQSCARFNDKKAGDAREDLPCYGNTLPGGRR